MMTKSKWIQNILAIVKYISDPDYQYRAWIKSEFDYQCHFEELISKLYDDGDLSNFIDNYSHKFNLSPEQLNSLTLLREKIDQFHERKDIYIINVNYRKIDEKIVLTDPEWKEIQLIAKYVLKSFAYASGDENDTKKLMDK